MGIILVGLTLLFCLPILLNLHSLGSGDWDQVLFRNESSQITLLHYHQFPFWNPYYCGGMPVLGNPQTQFFSPLFPFMFFFGVVVGIKIGMIFLIALGMIGMYFLARHFGISPINSLIPPMIFSFNGSFILHLAAGHFNFLSLVYIPFVVLFFLKSIDNLKMLPLSAIFFSLMFYQGGTYIIFFFLISFMIYIVANSFHLKDHRFLKNFVFILFLSILLAAPVLLPAAEYMHAHPRPTDPGAFASLGDLKHMFLEQYGLSIGTYFRYYGLSPWWEIGSYIGILPALLFIISACLFFFNWPLVLAGISLFIVGLGNFSIFSPWYLMHLFPPFNGVQLSARAFVVFFFYFSLLAVLHLERILKPIKKDYLRIWLPTFFALILFFDLYATNSPVLNGAFTHYKINPASQERFLNNRFYDAPFQQIEASKRMQFGRGAWSGMHPVLLKNQGTVNGYEPIPVKICAIPSSSKEYNGEFFLLNKSGAVTQTFWSPNKLIFDLKLSHDDVLVINQNYEKNWHSNVGHPVAHNGLLSIKIPSQQKQIIVWYFPQVFLFGIMAFMAGLGWAILLIIGRKKSLDKLALFSSKILSVGKSYFL